MVIQSNGLEIEQHGFRITAQKGETTTVSDVFELEVAARDCAQYLLDRGYIVSASLLMRETYAGETIEEWEQPIHWPMLEIAGG